MTDSASRAANLPASEFEKIRSQEYEVLREELTINRQFVFERPLLIVGVSLAALASADKDSVFIEGLILFFLLLLFFNLWFTFNRLSSNARILGYLRVVHESSESALRPGWENALSLHRTWLATHSNDLRSIESRCGALTMHDANRFYGGLFWFHLIMGGLAIVFGLLHPSGLKEVHSLVLKSIAIGIYGAGIVAALRYWNPYRPKNALEVQTCVWRKILRSPLAETEPCGAEPAAAPGS